MEWQGRQLSLFSNADLQIKYTYDNNGLRVSKTVNGEKTYYEYNADKLQYQEKGEQKLYFWYDAFGNLSKVYCVYKNGVVGSYMVVCNSRGDVDTLYNVSGDVVAKYTYDSWGNTISVTDANGKEITSPNHIGNINPIRYRGYYYDTETGLYYLQSRYYNPTVGRFLNADIYCDTQSSILGTNMFAYCGNNPVMFVDYNGFDFTWATLFDIIAVSIIIDSLTQGFRSVPTIQRTKNKYVPRIDKKKDAYKHQKSGARERNVAHPNGEEHSRVPKGNGTHRISFNNDFIPMLGVFTLILVVIILVLDDSTVIGVADDALIIPIIGLVLA